MLLIAGQPLGEPIVQYGPFVMNTEAEIRQAIADSWPACINDNVARKDWGLHYEYDLPRMTEVMLEEIRKKVGSEA